MENHENPENHENGGGTRPVRCPICGRANAPMQYCRHVRWTFDQGDPLEFARFALVTSPYTHARGYKIDDIGGVWWNEHGQWVVDLVLDHFQAHDGYVFGEIVNLDDVARKVWQAFRPETARAPIARM